MRRGVFCSGSLSRACSRRFGSDLVQQGPKGTLGTITVLEGSDWAEVDKVTEAYNSYFDHIRFRKGWAKPTVDKQRAQAPFREAAEYVVRIRKHLDQQRNEPVLRVRDGNAQAFLHSEACTPDLVKNQNRFVAALVQNTFQEAVGYVEKLNEPQVNRYLEELVEHRFNPQCHAVHLLKSLQLLVDELRIQPQQGEDVPRLERDNNYYLKEGSPEDKMWREAMQAGYEMHEKLQKLKAMRKPTTGGETKE
jgi:hypothetical protein